MTLERQAPLRYASAEPEDTEALGELIAPLLREGDVLILTGGLGAGKTRFTKGVARGLGDRLPVRSPTFGIQSIHDQGRLPLFHFDLYRLERASELEDTGIFDVLAIEGVCVLEWGERFQGDLVDEHLGVAIARLSETERLIEFEPSGARAAQLASRADRAVREALREEHEDD